MKVRFVLSVPIETFFLICKLYSSGLQIIPLISDDLRLIASVDIGGLYW